MFTFGRTTVDPATVAALVSDDSARVEFDEEIVRRGFWRKLRANLHRIPFLEDLLAAYYCATDPTTPFRVRAILFGALAYFVLPFDAIPDWLAIAGFTDDAAVLAAAIQAVRANLRPDHWTRAYHALRSETAAAEQSSEHQASENQASENQAV